MKTTILIILAICSNVLAQPVKKNPAPFDKSMSAYTQKNVQDTEFNKYPLALGNGGTGNATGAVPDTSVTFAKLAHSGVTQTILLADTAKYKDAIGLTLGTNLTRSHDTINAASGGGNSFVWQEVSSDAGSPGSGGTAYAKISAPNNSASFSSTEPTTASNNRIWYATWYKGNPDSLKSFYVFCNAPGSSQGDTITVIKNGTLTNAKIIITTANAVTGGAQNSDLTHTVTLADGDLVAYQISLSSGATAFKGIIISKFYSH